MDLGLRDRVALVVGGSGYIGRAVAATLHREGAQLVIAGRDPERLAAARASIGDEVDTIVVDTGDVATIDEAIAQILATHGRLDIVVNSAAPAAQTLDPALDRDPAQLLSAIDTKAIGALRVAEAALPHLLERGFGRIISIGGQLSRRTTSATASVRNTVLEVLSKSLADSVAGSGVTINVVQPARVSDTPSPEVKLAQGGDTSPTQIADVIAFLASEQAAGISGEMVAVGHRLLGVR